MVGKAVVVDGCAIGHGKHHSCRSRVGLLRLASVRRPAIRAPQLLQAGGRNVLGREIWSPIPYVPVSKALRRKRGCMEAKCEGRYVRVMIEGCFCEGISTIEYDSLWFPRSDSLHKARKIPR